MQRSHERLWRFCNTGPNFYSLHCVNAPACVRPMAYVFTTPAPSAYGMPIALLPTSVKAVVAAAALASFS
jgi:hypothetical protein